MFFIHSTTTFIFSIHDLQLLNSICFKSKLINNIFFKLYSKYRGVLTPLLQSRIHPAYLQLVSLYLN